MREIKFRGQALNYMFLADGTIKGTEYWVYGNLILDGKDAFIVDGVVEATDEYISIEQWTPVKKETIGQFTGLKDKNGKIEIYEGDIVVSEYNQKFTVLWENNGFQLKPNFEHAHYNFAPMGDFVNKHENVIKIIGNIHEVENE